MGTCFFSVLQFFQEFIKKKVWYSQLCQKITWFKIQIQHQTDRYTKYNKRQSYLKKEIEFEFDFIYAKWTSDTWFTLYVTSLKADGGIQIRIFLSILQGLASSLIDRTFISIYFYYTQNVSHLFLSLLRKVSPNFDSS